MAGRANVRPAQSDPRIGGRLARARVKKSGMAGDGEMVSLSEPLLDCAAAAALLNVRVSWVRDAARLGHLPCLRVGRHLRFTRVMLEDWLVVQLASPPAAGRAYVAAAATPRANTGRFRPSAQAALLASLAERPNGTAVEREG